MSFDHSPEKHPDFICDNLYYPTFRIDMMVQKAVVIENKTVEKLLPIHEAQLLTYLKLTKLNLGYLLNWNVTLMKYGIRRMVNNLKQ